MVTKELWNTVLTGFIFLFAAAANQAKICRAQSAYTQLYRPQVHFSPMNRWINDPNGLVYFHGEYHLFFQYNPFGDEWGHMSWGHAVSRDLLHWTPLPVALPETDGVMIFTGSVVVDGTNSSGFCEGGKPCLVAVYTGYSPAVAAKGRPSLQNQNLAYSNDDGRTWKSYVANPVLDLHMEDFRDPSVFRDEARHRWLMAISLPKEHKVRFYSSTALKHWTLLSDFGPVGDVAGDWECPDLLHIPPANGKGGGLWALKVGLNPGAPQGGSGEQYFLGDFDGKTFTASAEPGAHGYTNYGKDDYCAISFNGLPKGEKPVLIGWMDNWQYAAKLPTSPWRGQMSLPRQLSLVKDEYGLALRQEPLIAPLFRDTLPLKKGTGDTGTVTLAIMKTPFALHLRFDSNKAPRFGLRLFSDGTHWTEIGFDQVKGEFYLDRTHAGAEVTPDFPGRTRAPLARGRTLDLSLIVDRSSVEAYAQNGTVAMTDLIFPTGETIRVQLFSESKVPVAAQGEAHTLESIWQ